MVFILNVLFGFLAGFLTAYVARRLGADDKIAFVLGLIVGIIVYLGNFAVQAV